MEQRDKQIPCDFAMLFTRDVHHILENIFLQLDTESIASCSEVCQAWKLFLSSDSFKKKMYRVHLALLDDVDTDEEEIFNPVGPYQCEICQAISEMKEDFVYHIKKYHGHIVDKEVLESLDRDLLIRKKKKLMQNSYFHAIFSNM